MESATETDGEIVVHADDGGAHDTLVEIKKRDLLAVFGSEAKVGLLRLLERRRETLETAAEKALGQGRGLVVYEKAPDGSPKLKHVRVALGSDDLQLWRRSSRRN